MMIETFEVKIESAKGIDSGELWGLIMDNWPDAVVTHPTVK